MTDDDCAAFLTALAAHDHWAAAWAEAERSSRRRGGGGLSGFQTAAELIESQRPLAAHLGVSTQEFYDRFTIERRRQPNDPAGALDRVLAA